MSDETKIFTKNDKNGDKCASGGQESGLKLIFERGVAILVRPWRFPGQPKKFVFFSIKVGTINSGTSLDSREQFKKTGKLELLQVTETGVILPDEKDVPFYEVVLESGTDDTYLVTGNIKHFPPEMFIVTPARFIEIVETLAEI